MLVSASLVCYEMSNTEEKALDIEERPSGIEIEIEERASGIDRTARGGSGE